MIFARAFGPPVETPITTIFRFGAGPWHRVVASPGCGRSVSIPFFLGKELFDPGEEFKAKDPEALVQ